MYEQDEVSMIFEGHPPYTMNCTSYFPCQLDFIRFCLFSIYFIDNVSYLAGIISNRNIIRKDSPIATDFSTRFM